MLHSPSYDKYMGDIDDDFVLEPKAPKHKQMPYYSPDSFTDYSDMPIWEKPEIKISRRFIEKQKREIYNYYYMKTQETNLSNMMSKTSLKE